MIPSNVKKTGLRPQSFALLLMSLLGPLAAAQADTWSFNLVGAPVAVNIDSPGGESIHLTGAGTFDTEALTAEASGAFELFNAFDHPNGPIVRGTWRATGFTSFDGTTLVLEIETSDNGTGSIGTGELWVTEEGISGPIYADEPYRIPASGSGGGARFHKHGNG